MNKVHKLLVCTNFRANPNHPSCAARGSKLLMQAIAEEFVLNQLSIQVVASPCMGFCGQGPNVHLTPSGPFLHGVTTESLPAIIKHTKDFLVKNSLIKFFLKKKCAKIGDSCGWWFFNLK